MNLSLIAITRSYARLLCGALLLSVLTGCGWSISSGPGEPLTIRTREWSEQLTFQASTRDENSALYVVSSPLIPAGTPVFASAVRSCSVQEGEPLASVARRLFVGLDRLRIVSREEHQLDSHLLLMMQAEATLDETPLAVVSLSTISSNCAVDLVLWNQRTCAPASGNEEPALLVAQQVLRDLRTRGGDLLQELAP